MNKKYKIKTIEDIALQFIKHSEPSPSKRKINSNDTIIDSKFYIKKYLNNKNSDKILSNSFSKLIPYEEDNNKNISQQNNNNNKNNLKLIKFQKIPQKILGEEEEFLFEEDTKEKSKKEINNKNKIKKAKNEQIKIHQIKEIKYNKKIKLFFNINYRNAYDCINEIYLPLLQNLESISSFKSSTESTLNSIEFFCSHNSFFDLINSSEEKHNNNNDIIPEIMTEIKILEMINVFLILFILHIILEAKIEYIDNFNEDDIVKIYNNSVEVIKKIYEIIIFILQINEKNNTNNINTNNTSKFIKEYYKKETKIIYTEQIINKINNNISYCLNILFNACNILFGNLIIFKKDSGNIEVADEIEKKFLSQQKQNISNKANKNEKIYLSKEFNDQYTSFKTIYLYFIKNNYIKNKSSSENYNFLSNYDMNTIITKLSSVDSAFKEISNDLLLYYTNFKILLEKNRVTSPFLGPSLNPKKNFTLVVDLDETLVHYVEEESRAYVQVRPYADYFLTEMGKYFEIVIFTAAAEDYADIVLNELDKNNVIDYKLYRKHTEQINGVFIKDLSKLGRNINKIVIIDNNKDNFSLQPENGLHICSFLGDQDDDELYLLAEDLMKIVKGNKKDVRPAVKEIDAIMKKRYKIKNVILE